MPAPRIKFLVLSAVILFFALAGFVRWITRGPDTAPLIQGSDAPAAEFPARRVGDGFQKGGSGTSRELFRLGERPRRSMKDGFSGQTPERLSGRARTPSASNGRTGFLQEVFDRIWLPPGMTKKDIPPEYDNDLEGFLDRIEEVAEEDLSESEKENLDQVYFTTAFPDVVNGPPFYTDIFSPYSGRIYGAFNSRTENMLGRDRILVKWTGAKGELLLYAYMAILPDTPFNYVWWDQGFWDEGTYIMAVYGLENDVGPLAYGSYLVTSLPEFIGHLGLYEDLEQGEPQTDFSFSSRIILSFEYAAKEDRHVALVVFKKETGEYLIDEDLLLPAVDSGVFSQTLKEPDDPGFPLGTFTVQVWTEMEFPVGEVQFVHHE